MIYEAKHTYDSRQVLIGQVIVNKHKGSDGTWKNAYIWIQFDEAYHQKGLTLIRAGELANNLVMAQLVAGYLDENPEAKRIEVICRAVVSPEFWSVREPKE